MQKHTFLLEQLKENNISFIRWFSIDNFLYVFPFHSNMEETKNKVSKLFVEPDVFNSYDNFCLDMDKQIYPDLELIEYKPNRFASFKVNRNRKTIINVYNASIADTIKNFHL